MVALAVTSLPQSALAAGQCAELRAHEQQSQPGAVLFNLVVSEAPKECVCLTLQSQWTQVLHPGEGEQR